MDDFNEEFRFGSAGWTSEGATHRAGLFGNAGPMLGYMGQRPLRVDGDAPIITIGGAGSGKLRDLLAYNTCGCIAGNGHWTAPRRMFVHDSRGELAAVSMQNHARLKKAAYCINPFGLHGLPQHRVNPLDMLRPDSPTLHADTKLLTADVMPLSGSPNGEFFELRGRQWSEGITLHHVIEHGGVTLPQVYDLFLAIEDPRQWPDIGESMLNSPLPEVRQTAIEIHTKRGEAPKEYSAIMSEIAKSLGFLSDPAIYRALSHPDFSLEELCKEDCSVFNMIPAEYAALLAPMNRLVIGAAMLYKFRHPAAPRVLFLVDEAATLGRFESLLRGYTYGRGMGVRMWSIWQDVGQITRNFGHGALSSFLGSSQTRQFFGVRDLDTARLISAMLGSQTLEFDPVLDQAAAHRNMLHAARQMLEGEDPFTIALNARQQALAAVTRTKQGRLLMTPDEILAMPEDRQILFISGLGLKPILANKYPYFTRREMAGGYMPNPYHPPGDSVHVRGFFGQRRAPVITERVPQRYAHLPQYQSGQWSFVKGYRPI